MIHRIFTFYITYNNNNNNNNTLLSAFSTRSLACLEFHAPGGVRFGVDFAPYMVTKRFASAARQIRVCVVFHPMGAGHGSGQAPKKKSVEGEAMNDCVPSA